MKKIILITDAWSPQVNGAVTTLEKIVELLRVKGFELVIIEPEQFFTIPLFFYPEIKIALFPRKKISAIIRKEKPNHIHIATEGSLGLIGRSVCKRNNLKFTTSYHTHFPEYIRIRLGLFFNLTYRYLAWFHNAGVKTMVFTENVKADLDNHGFKKTTIWPLGVDIDLFSKRETNTINQSFKKPIFVYLGRIAVEKNVEEFLECDLPGTKLVIGDGPLRKKLEKKYGKTNIFVGYKRGLDLVNWLSICDVCIFPSYTDTFGLVIIEAMACGLPVAAHNVTGPMDIISTGIDGFLDNDLKRAALACLQLSKEKCREKSLKYSWNNSVDIFLKNLVEC